MGRALAPPRLHPRLHPSLPRHRPSGPLEARRLTRKATAGRISRCEPRDACARRRRSPWLGRRAGATAVRIRLEVCGSDLCTTGSTACAPLRRRAIDERDRLALEVATSVRQGNLDLCGNNDRATVRWGIYMYATSGWLHPNTVR